MHIEQLTFIKYQSRKLIYKIFNKETQQNIKHILSNKDLKPYQITWIKQILDNTIEHYVFNNNQSHVPINKIIDITNNIIKYILPLNNIVAIQHDINQCCQLQYISEPQPAISIKTQQTNNNPIIETNKLTFPIHHCNNINSSIEFTITQEIACQIIDHVINHILNLDEQSTINNIQNDKNTLLSHLHKQANNIARNSRRGIANTITTNPEGLAFIQMNYTQFKPHHKNSNSILFVAGTLDNFTILCYPYWNTIDHIPFLLNYKGSNFLQDVDSGLSLIPNLLVNIQNNAVNSNFKLINNYTNEKDLTPYYFRFVKAYF